MKVSDSKITLKWVYCCPKCPFYHSEFLPTSESQEKLLDLEIPRELPIFFSISNPNASFQSQSVIHPHYLWLFLWLNRVFEQLYFKLLSLQYFSSRRFKSWSKLEEWGMLRELMSRVILLTLAYLPTNPPKVQRHFTLHFVPTTSPQKHILKV